MKKEKSKQKPIHDDQGSAKDAKLRHKGMSHKKSQGDDCMGPGEFTKLAAAQGKDEYVKQRKMPSKGPFDSPRGKQAGESHKMFDPEDAASKKELTKVSKAKSRNTK